jgi:hypothetical protein
VDGGVADTLLCTTMLRGCLAAHDADGARSVSDAMAARGLPHSPHSLALLARVFVDALVQHTGSHRDDAAAAAARGDLLRVVAAGDAATLTLAVSTLLNAGAVTEAVVLLQQVVVPG